MRHARQHECIVHKRRILAVAHAVLILDQRIAPVVGYRIVLRCLHGRQKHHAYPLVRALIARQILPLAAVHGVVAGQFLDHHAGRLRLAEEQFSEHDRLGGGDKAAGSGAVIRTAGESQRQHSIAVLHQVGGRVNGVGKDDQLLAGILRVLDDQLRRVVDLRAVRDNHVGVFDVLHQLGVVGQHLLVALQRDGGSRGIDVDLRALLKRQEVVVVLDQDSGLRLKLTLQFHNLGVAGSHQRIGIGDVPRGGNVLGRSRQRQRLVRIGVGILEQTQLKLVLQDAVAGLVAAFFGDETLTQCLVDAIAAGLTAVTIALIIAGEGADLIKAVVDDERIPLRDGQA